MQLNLICLQYRTSRLVTLDIWRRYVETIEANFERPWTRILSCPYAILVKSILSSHCNSKYYSSIHVFQSSRTFLLLNVDAIHCSAISPIDVSRARLFGGGGRWWWTRFTLNSSITAAMKKKSWKQECELGRTLLTCRKHTFSAASCAMNVIAWT